MHFLFFCFHRPPLSTVHRCPPPTAHRPPPTAHRCPPPSPSPSPPPFPSFPSSPPVSARPRPSSPVLACPRLSTTRPRPRRFLHSPSLSTPSSPSPLPLPLIFPSLRPLFIPVLPLFIPVCSCQSLLPFMPLLFWLCPSGLYFLFPAQLVHVRSFISFFFAILSDPPFLLFFSCGSSCILSEPPSTGILFLHPVLHPLRASFLNLFFGHPFPCPPLRVPPLRILFLLCPSRILINAFNGSVCKEITLFLSGLKIIFIFVVLSD